MIINYTRLEDYKIALEEAKKIVARSYAIADAKLKSSKFAGEMIEDGVYASFLAWQLLSVLVRTQELTCNPENMDDDDNEIIFEGDMDLDDDDGDD